jgi:hypothetical protein
MRVIVEGTRRFELAAGALQVETEAREHTVNRDAPSFLNWQRCTRANISLKAARRWRPGLETTKVVPETLHLAAIGYAVPPCRPR